MPVVGKRNGTIITVLISLFLLGSTSGIAFVSSGNWVEVTRFTGDRIGISTLESFTCEHDEWRIIWEYVPNIDSNWSVFSIYVEAAGFLHKRVDSVVNTGSEVTNGTLYINDNNGTYYLNIISNVPRYTIIIEQNIDSIPEFPSWIILPLLLTVTLVIMVGKQRLPKTPEN